MDITDIMKVFGVPGQYMAYITAAIGVATIIVRALPTPSQNGTYKFVYDLFSRFANLTLRPSDIHTVPVSLPPKV